MGLVSTDMEPFNRLSIQNGARNASNSRTKRLGFTTEQVWLLLQAAQESSMVLGDLVRLGMWTGARLGELGALKVQDVHLDDPIPWFSITDSKTAAGIRQVPIHSSLLADMKRMVDTTQDGYVLSGLAKDRDGNRSYSIGQRFGKLKTRLGFGPLHTFHSFRHTVVTKLLNADGVQHHVVGGLVGHEVVGGGVTLGVYHKGADLRVLKDAIEKLEYAVEP
jgi:integrase